MSRQTSRLEPAIFENVPPLRWLDTLPVSAVGFAALYFVTVTITLLGSNLDDPDLMSMLLGGGLMTALPASLFLVVDVTKESHAKLTAFDASIFPLSKIVLGPKMAWVEFVGGVIYVIVLNFTVMGIVIEGSGTAGSIVLRFWMSLQLFFGFIGTSIVIRVIWLQWKAAQMIRINLYQARVYDNFSTVFVAFTLLVILVFSLILFASSSMSAAGAALIVWALIAICVPLFLGLLVPIATIAKRLKDEREKEFDRTDSLICDVLAKGDSDTGINETALSLRRYQDQILGVSNWPFAASARQIVVVGLLPPVSWAMGAMVEILLSSQM